MSQSDPNPSASNKRWLIKQISLFANLSEEQIDIIAHHSRIVEYPKDSVIYKPGEKSDAFFGIVSGRIRIGIPQEDGRLDSLEIVKRGDYFGIVSLMTQEAHSTTSQVINDAIVIQIPYDDFQAILAEIPELAIHLSTTLSKLILQRDTGDHNIYESTLISVYSPAPQTGLSTYVINLGASLKKETQKSVIVIDISPTGETICRTLGVTSCPVPLNLSSAVFDRSQIDGSIVHHATTGFDTLNVAHDTQRASDITHVAKLLSYLANRYHFVIIDLPHEMDRTVFKALSQADRIHLISQATQRQLQATAQVLQDLEKTVQLVEERTQVIVSEVAQDVAPEKRPEILGTRVAATLPKIDKPTAPDHPIVLAHPNWDYAQRVRRVSRELGKVLVGLVLGSGAAMGIAHIGILRVLEREQIPIDIIAGSSIGSLIGGLWCSGMSSFDIAKVANIFRTSKSLMKLVDLSFPKAGILGGKSVVRLLNRYLKDVTFEDLPTPLKIVACDYQRREVILMEEGNVVEAIRASCSIPGIFDPVKINGRFLIDGGILDPVPVNTLIQMGVHKLIAVNALPSPADIAGKHEEVLEERANQKQIALAEGGLKKMAFGFKQAWWNWRDPNLFDVIMHTIQSMEYEIAEASCAQADVALHAVAQDINWWEFHNVDALIKRGVEEAESHLDAIKELVGK